MPQITLIGIITVLLANSLRKFLPEYETIITLSGCIMIGICTVSRIRYMIDAFDRLKEYLNMNELYMETLLKVLGISYLSEFASNLCKDAGCEAIACQIVLFSKLQILLYSFPVALALLDTIGELPI